MGNKNRRNRGNNNQGNKQQAQTPVERIKFLYNGSRQKELIDVLVDDSIVRNNPKLIVELSSEFVSPILGMGLMEDLIDTEAEMLCSRMVLQAIKDFRSFHNDVDNMERIFNRIANDAVNNAEFESLGDDLFTTIQAEFPDVTDADAMRLAIYVFVNSTLKSVLGISDDIQTDEDENIEVSASTSTAEPETSDEKNESQEQIETEEVPLIESKDTEEPTAIDVEYREVNDSEPESKSDAEDTKADFELDVMAKLNEISDLAVDEFFDVVKGLSNSINESSDCVEITDDLIVDTIKSVAETELSTSCSPEEIMDTEPNDLLASIQVELVAVTAGRLTEIAVRTEILDKIETDEVESDEESDEEFDEESDNETDEETDEESDEESYDECDSESDGETNTEDNIINLEDYKFDFSFASVVPKLLHLI